jgi:SAM-dependent methyltransferase
MLAGVLHRWYASHISPEAQIEQLKRALARRWGSPELNFFASTSAAERYAKGRPYFHPQVIQRIKDYLSLTEPVPQALDVGCGTGLSTIALKPIAKRIVGVDAAPEMIALAPPDPQITYLVAPAEQLPTPDTAFNLMTLSSAFHWIRREAFLAEARRVLRPAAWLVIYDNAFTGRMQENSAFQTWCAGEYLQRYPIPPRNRVTLDAQEAAHQGFRLVGQERYENVVTFSPETLTDYLLTQSNVIAAVEGGHEYLEDVRRWLMQQVTPLFQDREEAHFLFQGPIQYLQKANE